MIRKYGILGLLMIVFAEVVTFLKIQPFATHYFKIIWFGYIFLVDSIVYSIKKNSLIVNRKKTFIFLILLSFVFWWVFEAFNISVKNWDYSRIAEPQWLNFSIAFSTVLPAVFETAELVRAIRIFDKVKLKKKFKISKTFLYSMIGFGVLCFVLPIMFPRYFFPLVWLSFFFLLDPINYLNKQPSIISHLKDRKLKVPLSLMLGSVICGFLWEFWNFWAYPKWFYDIPILGKIPFLSIKLFEMPILGYLGYIPFGLELYAMYYFAKWLLKEIKV